MSLILQVGEIEAAEKSKMREKCEKIISHGINCFINRQLIYNFPEEIFADAGELGMSLSTSLYLSALDTPTLTCCVWHQQQTLSPCLLSGWVNVAAAYFAQAYPVGIEPPCF